MSDAFSSLDRQRQNEALSDYINAINGRTNDENKVREENAEQKQKDDEYNGTLQSITDPLAQEFIRKPIEDIFKGTVNAFKARANKSLNSLGRKGVEAFKKSVLDKAKELGVKPEDLRSVSQGFTKNTTLGEAQEAFNKKLDSLKKPSSALNDGSPAQLDSDTQGALNDIRAGQGNLPRGDPSDVATQPKPDEGDFEEPQLVDAFTGKPVESKPLFDLEDDTPFDGGEEPEEFDDRTADLFDKPTTHSSLPPDSQPAPATDDAPVEGDNPFSFSKFVSGKGASGDGSAPTESASSRLSRVFKSSNLDDAPSIDFTGRSSRISQPKPPAPDSVAGDVSTKDQLSPMRDLMKGRARGDVDATPQFTSQQNQEVMETYRRTATQPPPKASDSTPSGQPEGGSVQEGQPKTVRPEEVEPKEPTPDDDQGGSGAGDVRDAEDGASKIGATTAEEAGEDALGEFGAIAGSEGGLNPIADVIGLVAGLGTLLGGLFGGKHHKDKPIDSPQVGSTVNPTDQVGVN